MALPRRRRYRGAMSATLEPAALPERGFNRFVAALSLRGVLLAMVLASLAAVLLNPIFVTPFPVLLGRMLVIALLLLLVFTAAGCWSVGWLPRWLVQVLAVVLTAPLATYLVYLPAVQGQVFEVLRHEGATCRASC
jgi:Zn-dependent protease with chaperone function